MILRAFFLSLLLFIALPALAQAETSWERVQREKTLHCGYMLYPPYMEKDIKTGQLMGPGYDFVEKLGQILGWKIIWAEETPVGGEVATLLSKRVDAHCAITGLYDPGIAPLVSFSRPYFYVNNTIYARSSDKRFGIQKTTDDLNQSEITFTGIEGDSTALYAKLLFPKAKVKELSQLSEPGQLFLELQANKADLVIIEPMVAERALRNNSGQFHQINFAGKLPAYAAAMIFPKEAHELRETIDTIIEYMNANGMIDAILDRYDSQQRNLLRIPKAWQEKK